MSFSFAVHIRCLGLEIAYCHVQAPCGHPAMADYRFGLRIDDNESAVIHSRRRASLANFPLFIDPLVGRESAISDGLPNCRSVSAGATDAALS